MYLGTLREFQLEGAKFFTGKRKAICAFAVGLGKTHIAMASIEKLREADLAHKSLIICPNYLKWKWAYELETWTDTPYIVVDGTPTKRIPQYDNITEDITVVINYELLLRDIEILKTFSWDVIVADEVTRIKGYRSKTKKALKQLVSKYKLGLTGTPISNRPDELYSIMEWVDPTLFGKWYKFEQQYIIRGHFGEIQAYKNLQDLARVAAKRMITKSQEEAAEQLPDIQEIDLIVEPTTKQKSLYTLVASSLEMHLDRYVDFLLLEAHSHADYETAMIRQRFSALRQICVSPYILQFSLGQYVENIKGFSNKYLDDVGAKILAVFDLIDEAIADNDNKMIIFSFYRNTLPLIETFLKKRRIRYRTIVGGMDGDEIIARARDFQNDPDIRVFLTTDAGEKGIDLQSANILVNLDIPFSWEKYEQRMGRIKRIGSKHTVCSIYNIILKDSFEERQLDILKQKRLLADTIQGKRDDVDILVPNEITLREFLKSTL